MRKSLFIVEDSVIKNIMLQVPITSETEVLGRNGRLVTSLLAGVVFVVLVSA